MTLYLRWLGMRVRVCSCVRERSVRERSVFEERSVRERVFELCSVPSMTGSGGPIPFGSSTHQGLGPLGFGPSRAGPSQASPRRTEPGLAGLTGLLIDRHINLKEL